jgi:AraC-like DNA-binding protein
LVAKTAPTVGAGIERLLRYKDLRSRADTPLFKRDESRKIVRIEYPPTCSKGVGAQCHNEFGVASLLKLVRDVAKVPVRPRSVEFAHAAPPDTSEHQAFFDAPVRFQAHRDAIEFDFDTMAIPVTTADPLMAQVVLDYLEALLLEALLKDHSQEGAGLEYRSFQIVRDCLNDGVLEIAKVAKAVGISERTLQRRLRECGHSYSDIVAWARDDLACQLIATTHLSLTDIAQSTGFSESSAFARAFKRWEGVPPSQYRKRLAGRL